jgi:hypothetical protein
MPTMKFDCFFLIYIMCIFCIFDTIKKESKMKILKTIVVAAIYLTRSQVKSDLLPKCERQPPAKAVCFEYSSGKCWQLTDPKKDKVDALYENGFCYEKMLFMVGTCWEKIYICQDTTTSTPNCYAKRDLMAMNWCPSLCTPEPHVHDPSYATKCFKLSDVKKGPDVKIIENVCYQRKPCNDPNVIYRFGTYWIKKPDWYRCSQCYAIKTECSGGDCIHVNRE